MTWTRGQPASPKYQTKQHRDERAKWAQLMQRQGYLTCAQPVCVMPSRAIGVDTPWHLGHDETGTSYIGPVHATCNVKDGARRGRAKQADPPRRWPN